MKVLVIGGGGREHAIVAGLVSSRQVEKVWCAPGNGGISKVAECIAAKAEDAAGLADLGERLRAELTVVGPEVPLIAGVAEEFARRGLAILGPGRAGAQLEGSKVFAKDFLGRHGIPTAGVYAICGTAGEVYTALCAVDWPVVLKADGPCAGKGVLVTTSPDEATEFTERVMEKRQFGASGSRMVLEEGLAGEELSYIILTDGRDYVSMAATRDHKRAYEGNAGPNTGGMGAYSSEELLPPELERKIRETILAPTLAGLKKDGIEYRGFLYFGLMLTKDGPKVLEFNCRLGDPAGQAILVRLDADLAELLKQAAAGELKSAKVKWRPGASACVVLASEGYPGEAKTGREIRGLEEAAKETGVTVFHAGTRAEGNQFFTAGGRVLGVTAVGANLDEALERAYRGAGRIAFEGMHYRKDIGRAAAEKRSV